MHHPTPNLTHLQHTITQLTNNPKTLHHTRTTTGQQALCVHIGGDHWYPETTTDNNHTHHATTICHQCPTQHNCLAIAIATNEQHGIWGAHNPHQRKQLANQLKNHTH